MGRVIDCPPSAILSADIEDESSSYANDGTAQHTFHEICLKLDCDPEDCRGDELFVYDDDGNEVDRFIVDDERIECANFYLSHLKEIEAIFRENFGEALVCETEVKIHLPDVAPFFQGTIDRLYYSTEPESAAHIVDYKHGAGVEVFAEDNVQLLCYALLVARTYKQVKVLTADIVQPRITGDKVKRVTIELDDIDEIEKKIREAVRLSNLYESKPSENENLFSAGDGCRWCPAKSTCPELNRETTVIVNDDLPNLADLPSDRLGAIIVLKKTVIERFEEAEKIAKSRIQSGESIPGFKLVDAKGRRKWKDESALVAELKKKKVAKAKTHETKLRSPAQLEKAGIDKALIASHVTRESTGFSLVRDSDKRAAISFNTAEEDFQPLVEKGN